MFHAASAFNICFIIISVLSCVPTEQGWWQAKQKKEEGAKKASEAKPQGGAAKTTPARGATAGRGATRGTTRGATRGAPTTSKLSNPDMDQTKQNKNIVNRTRKNCLAGRLKWEM